MDIKTLVSDAQSGDKTALEGVVSTIQDNIYYLALRMIVNHEDALDATQEILVKVITNLSSFRSESHFNTWVYRIAANHLLSAKKVREKELGLTFDDFKQDLENDLTEPSLWREDPQYEILLNELRISCTMAMLLCLTPDLRMAYILGDILELDQVEASEALSISKDNFRKRLSRARAAVLRFTAKSCGQVNESAKCRCDKKITGAIKRKRVQPEHIIFSDGKQYSYEDIKFTLSKTKHDLRSLALQESINPYKCPVRLGDYITQIVSEGLESNNKISKGWH